jgi:hypothetical protein
MGAGSVPAPVVRGAGTDRDLAAGRGQPGRDGAAAGALVVDDQPRAGAQPAAVGGLPAELRGRVLPGAARAAGAARAGREAGAVRGRPPDRGLVARADRGPPRSPDLGPFRDGSIASCDRWLKAGNEPGLRGLGTETIYSFIYRARQKVEKLWKLLPRGKARRGRRKGRATKGTINDRRSIHDRPEAVLGRQKLGDWEADLMFCRRTQPVLVLHERTSRLTLAANPEGARGKSFPPLLILFVLFLTEHAPGRDVVGDAFAGAGFGVAVG